jgi:hypothetical protein
VYKGEFACGLRHGLGSLYQTAGGGANVVVISGQWVNDVYAGSDL